MFDDLDFDNLLDEADDCHECASDARYCYTHNDEAARTQKAMDGWQKLKRMRERREMGDDIRTAELAIQLRDMGDKLDDIQATASRLIAAAAEDEKLLELRIKVARAAGYAHYVWQEYARAAEA